MTYRCQQNRVQFDDEFITTGNQKLPPGFAIFRRQAIYYIYSICRLNQCQQMYAQILIGNEEAVIFNDTGFTPIYLEGGIMFFHR